MARHATHSAPHESELSNSAKFKLEDSEAHETFDACGLGNKPPCAHRMLIEASNDFGALLLS